MKLTDASVRKAQPSEKPRKLADGGGLYLLIQPQGGKWWRLKYRFRSKEKSLSFGTYPDVGLKDARERRDAARKLLATGVDPGVARKAQRHAAEIRDANSFEVVAREWLAKQAAKWVSSHQSKIVLRLQNDIFPYIGKRAIAEIQAPELLACLRRVEERGAVETAHRILQNCGQIFRYAIATGRAQHDPAFNLRGALSQVNPGHRSSIIDPQEIGALLRAIDSYKGSFVVRSAMKLAPLVFVRPGELRQAEWAEIDLDRAEWSIPASKMKMREPHLVPLSKQAVAVLREIQPLTGRSRYVFPSGRTRSRPMSSNGVLSALRRMGYAKDEMSGHGFRAMARTVLDEVLHVRPDFLEHQLAHAVRDPNGRAYNRTAHLPERREMMQRWADFLDTAKNASVVVPILRKAG